MKLSEKHCFNSHPPNFFQQYLQLSAMPLAAFNVLNMPEKQDKEKNTANMA